MPSRPRSLSSLLLAGFGVVSSFCPIKIELAPAMKQSAWASSERDSRPALNRTIDAGIKIRAVAIILAISIESISGAFSSGSSINLHQEIDRHALRMRMLGGQLFEQTVAV